MRPFLSLKPETDYEGTIAQVRRDSTFRSGGVGALVFAILIASVGLNVNSTAVIIGAMLISPLMGPIVGAGFGLGTNDLRLIRRSIRGVAVAATISLIVSAVYFGLSPLEGAQSELLSRTRPTLYDVLIALFAGAAGALSVSRKTGKGNVVPGVAIATALMPPLCTAGYSLARGNFWFLLGALHLFGINALFICLSTVAVARFLGFRRVASLDHTQSSRVRYAMIAATLVLAVPSAYTAWSVIHETRFQTGARRFIADQLKFTDRTLLNMDVRYTRDEPVISATVIGKPLSQDTIASLQQLLPAYGLAGTKLQFAQQGESISADQVRQGILEDLYKRNEEILGERDARIRVLEDEVVRLRASQYPVGEIAKEVAALYPSLHSLSVAEENAVTAEQPDSKSGVVVVALWKGRVPSSADQDKLRRFLESRLKVETVRLVSSSIR